ncbi:hypothetical protein HNR26_003844 [Rhizobium rosettiformans]|uniref:Uncharacterized protein n=2 Tax=Rhizobium rosettiformans TaxID=1368430 RepID=A0A4S8PRS1_9HYPH|nr:hypothetical protein [Rhizobium rosettiformans]MBB5277755.1 hypothetical protein [Rhizobium rosettiformans]THV32921.1 hypothetical protein FAA86_18695 [Rhizobium rosettiformans W3]
MVKVMFQDANGNAPFAAAFCSIRESRGVMQETLANLKAQGVAIVAADSQRIVTATGAKYWLA